MGDSNRRLHQPLRVKSVRKVTGHASAEAAIRFAADENDDSITGDMAAAISGALIQSVSFTNTEVQIQTDRNQVIAIFVTEGNIFATVKATRTDSESESLQPEVDQIGAEPILDFGIAGMKPARWARAESLKSRCGGTVKKLSNSDFGLVLDVGGFTPLLFSGLQLVEYPPEQLLYWDELR